MKYRFEIIYRNQYMKKASEFLKNCDLEMGEIGIQETIIFTSSKNHEIAYLKEELKKVFSSCELEILRIQGGKIE